jgi:hypothetical protein
MAGFGGAIEAQGEVEIRETAFTGNATRYGAAISVWRPGRVRITGALIAENLASRIRAHWSFAKTTRLSALTSSAMRRGDCIYRYLQDRATQGCPGASPTRGLPVEAAASDAVGALAE